MLRPTPRLSRAVALLLLLAQTPALAASARQGGQRFKVLTVVSELAPLIKTGGLGDVAHGLPRELAAQGHEVSVALPFYGNLDLSALGRPELAGTLSLPWPGETVQLWRARREGVELQLIRNERLFGRDGPYGTPYGEHPDNDERFAALSWAALEAARLLGQAPDIVHAHDWPAGLAPAYLALRHRGDPFFARTASVFTAHNMAYQGIFPAEAARRAGLSAADVTLRTLEYHGKISYLKAGLALADKVTTVSRSYARETRVSSEFGRGMEGLLDWRGADFMGIVNGLDPAAWDPRSDPELPAHYGLGSWPRGKAANKLALQERLGLPRGVERPLFGVASRLDPQKGLDLVAQAVPLLKDLGAQLVMVGNGTKELEALFQGLMARHPETLHARTVFDERFARRVFAAADFLLMPSRFEPCGLSQLIAMRYGAIPLASPTGGLLDTVAGFEQGPSRATGFILAEQSLPALEKAILQALAAWRRPLWRDLVRNAMSKDSSWRLPARQYAEVYRQALAKKRSGLPLELGPRLLYPEIGSPIEDGTVVEGSKDAGGGQPAFRVASADPDLRRAIIEPARRIKESAAGDWEKLSQVQALVQAAIPRDGQRRRTYDSHNRDAARRPEVNLGNYLRCKSGVCRENALLTALALREAGFSARFAYFSVENAAGAPAQDHALALVDLGGATYVLDSYRPRGRYYNGHRLLDLLHPPVDRRYPLAGPLAADNAGDPGGWRLTPNPFPRVLPAPGVSGAGVPPPTEIGRGLPAPGAGAPAPTDPRDQ